MLVGRGALPVRATIAVSAASLFAAAVILGTTFQIVRFKSITDFWIVNRRARASCSVMWNQTVPVCSDRVADFIDLPFMHVFAREIEVSDWNDLALLDVALVPRQCGTFRVRHVLRASGIVTAPDLTTQTIWLTDGNVYTVAAKGLARGDSVTLCTGSASGNGRLELALRLSGRSKARFIGATVLTLRGHGYWWETK
jgi:hypothetical protein